MFGAIVSATDPVAVVALLKELGASRRLATLIEGESLLNDGTAMVVFLVVLKIVEGYEMSGGDMVLMFIRLSVGGPVLGLIFAVFTSYMLKRLYNEAVLEVNTTIFSAYLLFYVCELTPVHVSGILALVALGLYMTYGGKTNISAGSEESIHHVWQYIGFIAETIIFFLAGLIIGDKVFNDSAEYIASVDLGKLALLYLFLHFARFLIILLLWPCMRKMGYGITIQEVILLSYAGLRGAVGLALALIVDLSNSVS
eukprot:CAMPEP_0176347600 /NCGR_PEP_ID=MMETSP0126-20121128/7188_1 /TAXON_ID=141414 ORGANISM="Strombidinopsis acuminatum, Strain SPMC142" /NCGR_SAMPLE_ID=MMETSP0126 /ASSEMBLY_ACC=CAM_ASM_000229 /LENGTH=254 /DNA_ID=CAMNT_0017695875 /DNA_START=564 /DNA_END=1328 /DNA_ORIENTATION=-